MSAGRTFSGLFRGASHREYLSIPPSMTRRNSRIDEFTRKSMTEKKNSKKKSLKDGGNIYLGPSSPWSRSNLRKREYRRRRNENCFFPVFLFIVRKNKCNKFYIIVFLFSASHFKCRILFFFFFATSFFSQMLLYVYAIHHQLTIKESDTQRDLFAILIPSQKGFLPSLYHLKRDFCHSYTISFSLWYL